MQLLRLIRCEARRLLRNPAFFVLLIWGIWIVKDVCNPNMYGTYGTSDLGGVGKQIGFFANILDKTDPAGSAVRTALFMTYEWFFVLVGCIVISCAMDFQSRSSEVTYAKGTGVAKAVVAKWLVLTIATSTAFNLFSGFTLFKSPLGCYVDGRVFLDRYLPVLLLIDAILAALVAQSTAVFYLLRNAPLSIMLVLVGTLLASDEYTLVVFSNHASTQIPWWLSVGPYLRHLGNLCFQGLSINQIILFSVICTVVSLQLGVMGIKARRG